MFIQRREIGGKVYKYLDHSFRIGKKVRKVSFILDKDKQNYNEKIVEEMAKARAGYFKPLQRYFSFNELVAIETEKVFYQVFFNLLNEKAKQEILGEFARVFLSNSMELEGSTITPALAENIERKKKIVLPQLDVLLYNNSKKVLFELMKTEFRSVIQFKRFHKEIYSGIYPHAGEFKKQNNTFGYVEKANTFPPEKVRKELENVLKTYRKKEDFPFLRPLLFHLIFQRVHPFVDGNSRLGRILLVVQMFKQKYPPVIFKGDMSFQIRETLVEYCNRGNLDFCRLCMEEYLRTAKKFWRPMIKKFLFS